MLENNLNDNDMAKLRWNDVKQGKTKISLEKFNKFRKDVVDYLVKSSVNESRCKDCISLSVGSEELTSDYDITVNSINLTTKALEFFTDVFEEIFYNVSSSKYFDTNLYGIGFLIEISDKKLNGKNKNINEKFVSKIKHNNKNYFSFHITENDYKTLFNNYQFDWAMIHLAEAISHSGYVDINKYFFLYRGDYYNLYLSSLRADIQTEKQSANKYINGIKDSYAYMNDGICSNIDVMIYLNLVSKALFYGDETYYTRGSFMHVIGITQMGIPESKIIMSIKDYECSIIEQLAYVFKYASYYKDNHFIFLVNSAKYIARIYDALYRIFNTIINKPDNEKMNYYSERIIIWTNIKKLKYSKNNITTYEKFLNSDIDKYILQYFKKVYIEDKINANLVFMQKLLKKIDNEYIEIPIYPIDVLHKK